MIFEKGQENKETIIFLQGLVGNHSAFKPQFESMSDKFHCISYDYKGYGEDLGDNINLSMDLLVEQLLHIFEEKNIKKAHLCSLSFGFLVASTFAARYPEKVASLTCVGGYYLSDSYLKQTIEELWKKKDTMRYDEWVEEYVYKTNPSDGVYADPYAESGWGIVYEFSMALHPFVFEKAVEMQLKFEHEKVLPKLQMPTLWVMGEHDRLFKSSLYNLKNHVPHVDYREVSDASHVVQLQQAGVFEELYRKFLEKMTY